MFNRNNAQKHFEPTPTIVHKLSIVEDRVTSILAVDNALYKCCERICALEALADNLVVLDFHKFAAEIARIIPKIYNIKVELYSKELESDDQGYPVPARVMVVNVKTLSPTESAVREALGAYLDEFEIGGYCQPEAEIDEDLLF